MTTTRKPRATRKATPEPEPKPAPKPRSRTSRTAKPAPEPKPTQKPRTDSRGMLLDRVGTVEPKGSPLAGYVIRRPFPTNELLAHPDRAKAKAEGEPLWVVRCVAHGTTIPAPSATEAERLGTIKVRPEWCRQCAKEAKATQ
jgi:hypothetical protein